MTDSRLQELKRAWETSRSVDDEVAYLRERVRVGDLAQEQLEIAAYCDYKAASALVGNTHPVSLGAWVEGFGRFGFPWMELAAMHAARAVLPRWFVLLGAEPVAAVAIPAIEALANYLECPCEKHRATYLDVGSKLAAVETRAACREERRPILDAIHSLLLPACRSKPQLASRDVQQGIELAVSAVGMESVRRHIRSGVLGSLGFRFKDSPASG